VISDERKPIRAALEKQMRGLGIDAKSFAGEVDRVVDLLLEYERFKPGAAGYEAKSFRELTKLLANGYSRLGIVPQHQAKQAGRRGKARKASGSRLEALQSEAGAATSNAKGKATHNALAGASDG
tara:strand:- start:749 stop:1123 length:375 start_codon:yes stop_codon:yes gene_type:complete